MDFIDLDVLKYQYHMLTLYIVMDGHQQSDVMSSRRLDTSTNTSSDQEEEGSFCLIQISCICCMTL